MEQRNEDKTPKESSGITDTTLFSKSPILNEIVLGVPISTHKITVTDNGSYFLMAFKRYQPVEQDDLDEDEAVKTRFAEVLDSEDAVLAAVTLLKFKLRWLWIQVRKDKAKASLLAECRKLVLYQDQQAGTSPPTSCLSTDSAWGMNSFPTAESQVADCFKSGEQGIDFLNGFGLIKKISLQHNAATLSSAPVERLFSLGKRVLTPQRNRQSDQKFEKLLVLRYNHWFNGKNGWMDE
ncbi:hypothetical protein GBF38_012643 [Nibea albiflora]|uniref:Uncharacterized protein n=1 Tax=Nibea albiflora TaxID=240163 RepID=A0ACB7EZU9_NIBAL|nr:hypothetical protein GBF38_012643 [Nibea albiflora]